LTVSSVLRRDAVVERIGRTAASRIGFHRIIEGAP